jgi:PEGA domain
MGDNQMTDYSRLGLRLLALACVAGLLSACATVTRGTDEAFTVDTVPGGATVHTSNGYSCDQTPCVWRIRRNADFEVTISKPGYKTVTTGVSHTTSGAGAAGLAGNVLIGGVIGIGVDAVTGASQDLKPNPLHVVLEADAPMAPPPAPPPPPAVTPAPASPTPAAK